MKKKIIFIIAIIIVFIIVLEIGISKNNNNQTIANNTQEEIQNATPNNEAQNETEADLNKNEIQENIKENNNNTVEETTEEVNKDEGKIKKEVAPSGFMGASLYKVYLYANGNTYVVTFDGDGYEEKNIVTKKLIAKNVKSIETSDSDEDQGMVIVKGGEAVNEDFGWISFSK